MAEATETQLWALALMLCSSLALGLSQLKLDPSTGSSSYRSHLQWGGEGGSPAAPLESFLSRAGKMTQWIKVPDDLSPKSKTHLVDRKKQLPQVVFQARVHAQWRSSMGAHTNRSPHVTNVFLKIENNTIQNW